MGDSPFFFAKVTDWLLSRSKKVLSVTGNLSLGMGSRGPCGSGASGGSGSGRLPGDTDTPRSRGTWLPARARGWDVARGQRPAAPIIPDPPWPDGLCRLSLGLDSPDGAGPGCSLSPGSQEHLAPALLSGQGDTSQLPPRGRGGHVHS